MYIPGPAINVTGTPRFVARKLFADDSRIKRKPPRTTTEDESKPGYLCWGVVGDLPSAQPVPEVSFEVHSEVSRKTEPVRIENPDDPDQHVNVDQTKQMTLEKTVPAEKNNSSTQDSDVPSGAFRESGADAGGSTTVRYTVDYKPPERAV